MSNIEQKIDEMYDSIHESIKEDTVEAGIWARDILTKHEGAGHIFHITANGSYQGDTFTYDGLVVCSFAKPQWSGDHCGSPMESGAEAIVRAVCEYLCGA